MRETRAASAVRHPNVVQITSALFGAHTPPESMRARFARFAHVSRAAVQRKHPSVVFDDHTASHVSIEAVRSRPDPRCAIIHLHGGAFVFGSASSYRNRAMRLAHRCQAEVFVPN